MKLIPFLVAGALLAVVAPNVLAAPDRVAPAPRLAPSTACAPDKNSKLYKTFYRLPAYVFRYFGNMERYKLIDDDLITFDEAKGYIEIPYQGRSNHPDRDQLYSWQMKVFRDKKGAPVIAVSSTVKGGTPVKPFVHIFRSGKNGDYVRTTARDFPFKISYYTYKGQTYANSFFLPRSGDKIIIATPQTDENYSGYIWTGSKFVPHTDTAPEYGA